MCVALDTCCHQCNEKVLEHTTDLQHQTKSSISAHPMHGQLPMHSSTTANIYQVKVSWTFKSDTPHLPAQPRACRPPPCAGQTAGARGQRSAAGRPQSRPWTCMHAIHRWVNMCKHFREPCTTDQTTSVRMPAIVTCNAQHTAGPRVNMINAQHDQAQLHVPGASAGHTPLQQMP